MSRRVWLALVVAVCIGLFFLLDLGRYLSFAYLEQHRERLQEVIAARPLWAGLCFGLLYVAVTSLSLPGAAVLTLAAGALFGLFWGTLLVSFASTVGATCAFLISRLLFRQWLQSRFGDVLASIDRGMARDGVRYLFTLRLVPLFPFFLINVLMGVTPIGVRQFFWVSQLGMLPGTLVYVNAGTQLAGVASPGDLLSPALVVSFALLGLFPWFARWGVNAWRRRLLLAPYTRPARFDANLIVVGAGSAGLVSSLIAATVKARVVLVEQHRMGGDCLNTGCVPSKTLLRSAQLRRMVNRAPEFGIEVAPGGVDFARVMSRVRATIAAIEPNDSVERYSALGVQCVSGSARLISPWEVQVGDRVWAAPRIVIATGARPLVPPWPGLGQVPHVTSDDVWTLQSLPARLLVLGAGPIGCELAQGFARLGSAVTLLDMAPTVLPREDADVSDLVARQLHEEGIELRLDHRVEGFLSSAGTHRLVAVSGGERVELEFDLALVAIGRKARVEGLGLEELGVELTPQGTVAADEYLCTRVPTIYACGDVVGPYQFTHMASHQAWYATVNALFGRLRRFAVDYSVVPWATFTDPEVARVGLSEVDARRRGIAVEVTCYSLAELDRARADGDQRGFVKVLTAPGRDRILGATIVGAHAGELIHEFVLAMRHNLGLGKILGTIHVYPTWSESARFVAGNWRKAHAPERLLGWAERYHRWVRERH